MHYFALGFALLEYIIVALSIELLFVKKKKKSKYNKIKHGFRVGVKMKKEYGLKLKWEETKKKTEKKKEKKIVNNKIHIN